MGWPPPGADHRSGREPDAGRLRRTAARALTTEGPQSDARHGHPAATTGRSRAAPRPDRVPGRVRSARSRRRRPGEPSASGAARSRSTLICWPSFVTATTMRMSCAAGCSRATVAASGRSATAASASGGSTMRSTTRAAPTISVGPLDPGQEHVELLVVRGSGLLERGQRRAALEDPELGGQLRLRGADVVRRHEGEQQRGLVPPLAGDVLLDVQRGGEQVLGVHGPSLPAR